MAVVLVGGGGVGWAKGGGLENSETAFDGRPATPHGVYRETEILQRTACVPAIINFRKTNVDEYKLIDLPLEQLGDSSQEHMGVESGSHHGYWYSTTGWHFVRGAQWNCAWR